VTFHCYDPIVTTTENRQERDEMDDEQGRYSLSDLTDEAGVSVRTVRYYIAEGLLPPPITAGPRSAYTQGHLDRLRLIDRMKANYLPLKEIRRRLTALDDNAVRHLAEQEGVGKAAPTVEPLGAAPPDSASSYIARLLHRQPPAAPAATPSARPQQLARAHDFAVAETIAMDSEPPDQIGHFLAEPDPVSLPAAPTPDPDAGATSWRRISLGDDAELLVRDETYQRKRDRVDWLVGWARKVFG
jgi:DNA-binding transcriptional MerR regulator